MVRIESEIAERVSRGGPALYTVYLEPGRGLELSSTVPVDAGWNDYDAHAKKHHTSVEDGSKTLLETKQSAWKTPSGSSAVGIALRRGESLICCAQIRIPIVSASVHTSQTGDGLTPGVHEFPFDLSLASIPKVRLRTDPVRPGRPARLRSPHLVPSCHDAGRRLDKRPLRRPRRPLYPYGHNLRPQGHSWAARGWVRSAASAPWQGDCSQPSPHVPNET